MTRPLTVLIIEDDESHLELIRRAFDSLSTKFLLEYRSTLKASLEYLQKQEPDIVLCDWNLPDGKGMDIFHHNNNQVNFPVVMMTSQGNEELAVEVMKKGALDYIVKSPQAFADMPNFLRRGLREWQHILARRHAESRLRQTLMQTVESFSMMVEKRDPYTSGHQKKVGKLACAIAREMNLNNEQIEGIYIAANLHDIGKISIPVEFLNKPGRLSEKEMDIIKIHPETAYDMLKAIDFQFPVATVILQHHEKMDGSGYPFGLTREDILLESRIITVADVVEAISSHRPYRPALGIEAALEEISDHAGTLYDRKVVEICLSLFVNGFRFDL
ncbi:MAG: HD domain-containing phosphohydrolase [Syntrophomonadaceae bacterium]|jgi:putative two-component system response regulator